MITFSVVLFNNSISEVYNFYKNFDDFSIDFEIIFVDNGDLNLEIDLANLANVRYFKAGRNLGYGNGHNFAFSRRNSSSYYYVVCNLDIIFKLSEIVPYLARLNDRVLLVSPKFIGNGSGIPRIIPFPCSVTIRKFGYLFKLPRLVELVEMNSSYKNDEKYLEVASGAFMLLKTMTFLNIGGFDKFMWMYIEDWDLSYRIWKKGRVLYVPGIVVEHRYNTRRGKSLSLVISFVFNLCLFKLKHQFPFDRFRFRIKRIIKNK